jgi:hypothetical protein
MKKVNYKWIRGNKQTGQNDRSVKNTVIVAVGKSDTLDIG